MKHNFLGLYENMAKQQRKKLSLEEARAMFNDSPKKSGQRRKSGKENRAKKNYSKEKNLSSNQIAQIEKRITMLERRVMEGTLDPEEEQKILREIEYLEKQKGS